MSSSDTNLKLFIKNKLNSIFLQQDFLNKRKAFFEAKNELQNELKNINLSYSILNKLIIKNSNDLMLFKNHTEYESIIERDKFNLELLECKLKKTEYDLEHYVINFFKKDFLELHKMYLKEYSLEKEDFYFRMIFNVFGE